ncbi:MAG TPA: hypothetical protein VMV45_16730 [Casimicrobiaceae bacterium]|nr:hypothetical protein [Casimicrobiaceae bacterium]
MRTFAILLAALLATACAPPDADAPLEGGRAPIVVSDPATGLLAVTAVGAHNVRVLYVRPPSIVLLREQFVPDGKSVTGVQWSGSQLIVETEEQWFALDTRTWQLAAMHAHGVAARATSTRSG